MRLLPPRALPHRGEKVEKEGHFPIERFELAVK